MRFYNEVKEWEKEGTHRTNENNEKPKKHLCPNIYMRHEPHNSRNINLVNVSRNRMPWKTHCTRREAHECSAWAFGIGHFFSLFFHQIDLYGIMWDYIENLTDAVCEWDAGRAQHTSYHRIKREIVHLIVRRTLGEKQQLGPVSMVYWCWMSAVGGVGVWNPPLHWTRTIVCSPAWLL